MLRALELRLPTQEGHSLPPPRRCIHFSYQWMYLKYVHIFKCLLCRRWDTPPQQEANEANMHPACPGWACNDCIYSPPIQEGSPSEPPTEEGPAGRRGRLSPTCPAHQNIYIYIYICIEVPQGTQRATQSWFPLNRNGTGFHPALPIMRVLATTGEELN